MISATPRSVLLVVILTHVTGLANGQESGLWLNCGQLNGDSIYINGNQVTPGGDTIVGYTQTYKTPVGTAAKRYRSSKVFMTLDIPRSVYFQTGGFDCTLSNGQGTCSHFEFIPGAESFRRHMNDRKSWDKIAKDNIGGFISRCLRQPRK